MNRRHPKFSAGFSLVETMIATFVMGLVIVGGLVAVGQATLLSEKGREQIMADFYLRAEVERLRAMTWSEIEALRAAPEFVTLTPEEVADLGLTATMKATRLSGLSERGKNIFHLTMSWTDKNGRADEESRVLVVTEGGLSAK